MHFIWEKKETNTESAQATITCIGLALSVNEIPSDNFTASVDKDAACSFTCMLAQEYKLSCILTVP